MRGSVSVDGLQKLEYCYTNTDWEDRLHRRRERERKRRAPETGGTLEKAMELVLSHSQRVLSCSSSPACIVLLGCFNRRDHVDRT